MQKEKEESKEEETRDEEKEKPLRGFTWHEKYPKGSYNEGREEVERSTVA